MNIEVDNNRKKKSFENLFKGPNFIVNDIGSLKVEIFLKYFNSR